MKKFFILFFIFLFIFLSVSVHADIYEAMQKVESYFSNMHGEVIDNGVISIGRNKSLIPGTNLRVFSAGDEIVHPITGQVIGRKSNFLGDLVVTKVERDFSYVKFNNIEPQPGDSVGFSLPVGLSVEYEDSQNYKSTIEGILSSSSTLSIGNDYTLRVRYSEGAVYLSVVQKDSTTIFTTSFKTGEQLYGLSLNTTYNLPSERFYSLVYGKFYDDGKLYAAASTSSEVYIFDIDNSYRVKYVIDDRFSSISNIEVADLNNNGIDELYVTTVKDGKYLKTYIYEYSAKQFRTIQNDLKFFVRSAVDADGKRVVYGQQMSVNGGYKGAIYKVVHEDGDFILKEAIPGSVGKNLFGFALLNCGDDKCLLNVNDGNRLEVWEDAKRLFLSSAYYGDTINKIETVTKIRKRDDFTSSQIITIEVNPRIEVLDNSLILLVKNEIKDRIFVNSPIFDESQITLNSFEFSTIRQKASSATFEPLISDIFAYKKDGVNYIAVLSTTNDWFFKSAQSSIRIFKISN